MYNEHSHDETLLMVERIGYQKVCTIALKMNGMIYGGYVRDSFIMNYFSRIFEKNHPKIRYWDKTYSPETIGRIIMPSDIDICFSTEEKGKMFIEALKDVEEFHKIYERDVSAGYYSPLIKNVIQVTAHMIVGSIPFVRDGVTIILYIDVVIAKNSMIGPPFNNLDMLCNGFLITNHGTMYSKNTGTIIDTYSDYERLILSSKIIQSISKFRTYLCFSKDMNNVLFMRRIEKMIAKKMNWEFINLPFNVEPFIKKDIRTDETCCICKEEFVHNESVSYTSVKKDDLDIHAPKMHYTCLMKYLRVQRKNNTGNTDTTFTFKCPVRNIIDFSKCNSDIEKICDAYDD